MSASPLINKDGLKDGLTITKAAFFILSTMSGSSTLALPIAIESCGLFGVVLLVLWSGIGAYLGTILGEAWTIAGQLFDDCHGHIPEPYPVLVEKAYGTRARIFTKCLINMNTFGVCVVMLLMAVETTLGVLESLGVYIPFCCLLVTLCVVLVPFSWLGTPKDIWVIAVSAVLTTGASCVILLVIFGNDYTSSSSRTEHSEIKFIPFSMSMGIMLFSIGGHFAFLTIQTDMKDRGNFRWAIAYGYTASCVLMNLPVVLAAYFTYGKNIQSNILKTVSPGPLVNVVNVLFSLHYMCHFIVILNPLLQSVESTVSDSRGCTPTRIISRTVVMVTVLLAGLTFPGFDAAMSLVAGTSETIIDFIGPILLFKRLKTLQREHEECPPKPYCKDNEAQQSSSNSSIVSTPFWMNVLHGEILLVGAVGGILATVSAAVIISKSENYPNPCFVQFA